MTKHLLDTLHQTARGIHNAGVMSEQTMREFDVLCLPPVKHYSADDTINIRKKHFDDML